jgi:DNA-binding transcriptional ArsR family regulator
MVSIGSKQYPAQQKMSQPGNGIQVNENHPSNLKKPASTAEIDPRVIKALGHPLRQRILQTVNGRVASPNEIASSLDEPLGNVSYHVKILLDCEAIELVRTSPVRGALEHFYSATMKPRLNSDHWRLMPASTRRQLQDQNLQQIWERVIASAEADGLNDPDTSIAWVDLDLDDEAVEELNEALSELMDQALTLQEDTALRFAGLDDDERRARTRRMTLALKHFPRV